MPHGPSAFTWMIVSSRAKPNIVQPRGKTATLPTVISLSAALSNFSPSRIANAPEMTVTLSSTGWVWGAIIPPAGSLTRNPMGSAFFMSPYRMLTFTPAGKAGLSDHCNSEGCTITGWCSLVSGSAAMDAAGRAARKMANVNVSSGTALMMPFLISRVVMFMCSVLWFLVLCCCVDSLSRLTRRSSATAGGGERRKYRELFHKIKRGLHSGQRPAPCRVLRSWLHRLVRPHGITTSFGFEPISKCNRFLFHADSVHDGNHGARLEHKRRQHRAELVHRQRIVAIQHHISAPVTHPDHEQLDLEIGGRLPLRENLQNPLLGILVFDGRALRTFGPGEHVFHRYLYGWFDVNPNAVIDVA